MRNLIVSVEAYPDLKSNQNFLALQSQLVETEDRIANGRRYYNANVAAYNTRVESVPSNIIAGIAHFEKATYFEVNDPAVRQAPSVSFGEIAYRGERRRSPAAAGSRASRGARAAVPAAGAAARRRSCRTRRPRRLHPALVRAAGPAGAAGRWQLPAAGRRVVPAAGRAARVAPAPAGPQGGQPGSGGYQPPQTS